MTLSVFDSRRWVLPLASLVPVAAIIFAFSLGPSPRKRLQAVYQSESVDPSELARLAEIGDPVLEALTEDVQRPETPHRPALIRFLGERKYMPAAPALRRLVTTVTEPAPVRTASLVALKTISDRPGMLDLAKELAREKGPLGEAARKVVAELSAGRS